MPNLLQNPALTVLFEPNSLHSGEGTKKGTEFKEHYSFIHDASKPDSPLHEVIAARNSAPVHSGRNLCPTDANWALERPAAPLLAL